MNEQMEPVFRDVGAPATSVREEEEGNRSPRLAEQYAAQVARSRRLDDQRRRRVRRRFRIRAVLAALLLLGICLAAMAGGWLWGRM